jgi:protoporphyrin/coproporphyrin ferrochelatase
MGVSQPIGVLVMAYGTADGPADIERYYTDIRGGRAPAPHHLQELAERYAAIGNRFPLREITREQASGLERELNSAGGGRFRSYLGMKHSPPFIPEGVARMKADRIRRAVGLVMAPHWSGMSIETYACRARAAIEEQRAGIDFTYVRQWHDHPAFVEFLAARVRAALDTLPEDEQGDTAVVFSAHSLPQRTVEDGTTRCLHCSECPEGCTYRAQLLDTADLVAGRLGLAAYATGWQSAGRTADPWLGPPVEEVIGELAAQGHPAVVVCSAGFVADHLEILYDLDIEAQGIAAEAGVRLVRTEMPNADPAFIRVLADVVRAHLGADVSQPA